MYDIERILDMLRKCKSVAEPDIRDVQGKNFAECHDYIMDKYDYLGIIKQILGSEVISKSRSYMHKPRSYYMNYIFEFMHPGNNYTLRSGQVVDEYIDIYIKLVFDYAKDYVVAVVSFHEPEQHKKLAKAAFPDYEKINPAVKAIDIDGGEVGNEKYYCAGDGTPYNQMPIREYLTDEHKYADII